MNKNSIQKNNGRVWVEIDTEKLTKNFKTIQSHVDPAMVMTVLKADAYGMGAAAVGNILEQAGADRFGVAEIGEASALRTHTALPIQVLGALLPSEIEEAVTLDLICPVGDIDTAKLLSQAAVRQEKTVTVHVLVDTGMGRLGVPYKDAEVLIRAVHQLPAVAIEGLYSHFPNANDPEDPFAKEQIARFKRIAERVSDLDIPLMHIANSDGINNVSEAVKDWSMVRTGINLYGAFDLLGYKAYELEPVIELKSRLIAKRTLPKGYSIGYGKTHLLEHDTLVGTIPAGYADGVPFALSNNGHILIGESLCPIIGLVSMDYLTVDLSSCPDVNIGDDVILIGANQTQAITVEQWARIKDTHPYDIICAIGNRVERMFV